jgi:type VII secretion protein EccB
LTVPLNLSNRDQSSGHLFYNRRLRAAITRYSVRMAHDDRKQQAAVALSVVLVAIGVGWMALLHVIKPAGLVGRSAIVGDRDTGQVYAKIDGRLYPALNLTSARLAVGSAAAPSWVKTTEIAKHPSGPVIGIPGAPDQIRASVAPASAWAVCDTAATGRSGAAPVVTSIAGELFGGGRAAALGPAQAILVTYHDAAYVIWGGHRSAIDAADRLVTLNLGLDPGLTRPITISNALFDALPATEPLVVPAIPQVGTPSTWLPGMTVGAVLQTRDAGGAVSAFYVLLPGGVQKISGFVADLLRTNGAGAPSVVGLDKLIGIPIVDVLNVDFYPVGKLNFVDTAANPVTCLTWQKQPDDPQARVAVVNGRGLPVPIGMDSRVVTLVRDDRNPDSTEADQTLVLPGAANFIATTSAAAASTSRESLYWISPQGVRYGIDWESTTLRALALDSRYAGQVPWPIVRTFAPGPAMSRADALLAHDTVGASGRVAAVPGG